MSEFIGFILDENQQDLNSEESFEDRNDDIDTQRNPDDLGYFHDGDVSFGYIENGHQTVSYENDRCWIIFNGKIYNHEKLRNEIKALGLQIATSSAAEIIIALYSVYKEKTPEQLRGMFAFVIWDKQERILFAARDHFGIKPLFYAQDLDRTYFASEKKSILLATNNEIIDPYSLQHYLTYQYVPEPSTLSMGIEKLLPGHYLIKQAGEEMVIQKYWAPSFSPIKSSESELVTEVRKVLFESVETHMQSELPVGSFLSSGLDSSLIVSIAKDFKPNLKTYSVGFEHNGFSEIENAKKTADMLGLENNSYVVSPEEFMKELPKIVWHLDDPLADTGAIPLYFVAREASKHVSVILSGEGADELFGGYHKYRESADLEIFKNVPARIKSMLRKVANAWPEGVRGKNFIERAAIPMEERYIGNDKIFNEAEKRGFYNWYTDNINYLDITNHLYEETREYGPIERMQYIDIHTWLPGDILLKADKITRANSLELRVPFLDKEVFNVASKIGTEYKTVNKTTKYILRKAAEGIVPEHVLNRRELAFPVPIRHWLKDEMYDWALQIINESQTEDIFNKEDVIWLLKEHGWGKADHSRKLWTILIFMVWHQVFVENKYNFHNVPENEYIS